MEVFTKSTGPPTPDVFAELQTLDRRSAVEAALGIPTVAEAIAYLLRFSAGQQFRMVNQAWDRAIERSYRRATTADFGLPESKTHKVAAARISHSISPPVGIESGRVSVHGHRPAHVTQQPNKL